MDARLARAFHHLDPDTALRPRPSPHPVSAAPWRRRQPTGGLGGEVHRAPAGVSDRLARTLTWTNPVESTLSFARTTARNVKRWKDVHMVCRWNAAGMLAAERSFRQVKGCKDMPTPVATLTTHVEEVTVALSA